MCFDGVGGEVTLQSLQCLARGGRHLVVGFASGIEAEEVPVLTGRMLCFGNFDVLGVILAYLDDDITPSPDWPMPVPVPRFNPPPASVGRQVHADLLDLLDAGAIRPLVGEVVPFTDLPQALDAWSSAPRRAGSSSSARHGRGRSDDERDGSAGRDPGGRDGRVGRRPGGGRDPGRLGRRRHQGRAAFGGPGPDLREVARRGHGHQPALRAGQPLEAQRRPRRHHRRGPGDGPRADRHRRRLPHQHPAGGAGAASGSTPTRCWPATSAWSTP